MSPHARRVALALLGVALLFAVVSLNWLHALVHAVTIVVTLLVDDVMTLRRRVRELEKTVQEMIET